MPTLHAMLSSSRRSTDLIHRPPYMPDPLVIYGANGVTAFPRADDITAGFAFAAASHPQDPGRPYYRADLDVVLIGHVGRQLTFYGGRHVRVIGATITADKSDDTLVFFENNFGSVFFEGCHINAANFAVDCFVNRWASGVSTDAGVPSLSATPLITIQAMLTSDNYDDQAPLGMHVDGWQSQGNLGRMRMEKVTFNGGQQAVYTRPEFTPPLNGVQLRKVNVRRYHTPASYTRAYYLAEGGGSMTTASYPIKLDDVWAERNTGAFTATTRSVYPLQPEKSWGGVSATDAIGEYCDFTSSPVDAEGIIRIGVPPGGDFVTTSEVGSNYVSPWGGVPALFFAETWGGSDGAAWNSSRWPTIGVGGTSTVTILTNRGRLLAQGAASTYARALSASGVLTNFHIDGMFRFGGTSERYASVVFRSSGAWHATSGDSPQNGYFIELAIAPGGHSYRLFKRVSDTLTALSDPVATTFDTNNFAYRIVCRGSSIKAAVWQTTMPVGWPIDVVDGTHGTGSVMLSMRNTADGAAKSIAWDNLVVREIL